MNWIEWTPLFAFLVLVVCLGIIGGLAVAGASIPDEIKYVAGASTAFLFGSGVAKITERT